MGWAFKFPTNLLAANVLKETICSNDSNLYW
jgi:hypothetical protein